jgi:hypothetical protein
MTRKARRKLLFTAIALVGAAIYGTTPELRQKATARLMEILSTIPE